MARDYHGWRGRARPSTQSGILGRASRGLLGWWRRVCDPRVAALAGVPQICSLIQLRFELEDWVPRGLFTENLKQVERARSWARDRADFCVRGRLSADEVHPERVR